MQTGKNDSSRTFKISLTPSQEQQLATKIFPGETVKGVVCDVISSTKSIIDFKGVKVIAYFPVAMSKGEEFFVRIDRVKPVIVMNLLHSKKTKLIDVKI